MEASGAVRSDAERREPVRRSTRGADQRGPARRHKRGRETARRFAVARAGERSVRPRGGPSGTCALAALVCGLSIRPVW